jgi:hypothetical protein
MPQLPPSDRQPAPPLADVPSQQCDGRLSAPRVRDAIVDLAKSAPRASIIVDVEPKLEEFGYERQQPAPAAGAAADAPGPALVATRGDIHLRVGDTNTSIMIDVTVTHPNASTTPATATTRLAAIKASATSKVNQYKKDWKIETKGDGKLVIAGYESSGACNKDADETCQFIGAIKFPDNFDGLRSEFICNYRRRVAVALINGNVSIYRRFLQSCFPGVGVAAEG